MINSQKASLLRSSSRAMGDYSTLSLPTKEVDLAVVQPSERPKTHFRHICLAMIATSVVVVLLCATLVVVLLVAKTDSNPAPAASSTSAPSWHEGDEPSWDQPEGKPVMFSARLGAPAPDEEYQDVEVEDDNEIMSFGAVRQTDFDSPPEEMVQEEALNGTETVEVRTIYGKLTGVTMTSRLGRKYYAFLKIPYAQSPTGSRRFKAPAPIRRWQGTLDATVYPPECIQKVKYSPIIETAGAEDCLYMSIYTPKLPGRNAERFLSMPVMFYIHGGGFVDGNGTRYGAKYFMDEDVVLITFQYRIGPFGFLNTMDGDIKGNLGLKDQVQAMRFTHRIIRYFGGDRQRLTIFGNSAGGQSVAFHLLSSLSTGWFSRAIMQSGVAISTGNMVIDKNPQKTAKLVAERFNCSYGQGTNGSKKQKLSDCLRDVDASAIALVRDLGATYQVTIEPNERGAFMVDMPLDVMRAGEENKVALMAGFNSGEGLMESIPILQAPLLVKALNKAWARLAPLLFMLNSSALDVDAMSYRVRDFFFGNASVSNDTLHNLTDLSTDRFMGHSTKVQATYQAAHSPVYLYFLTKRPAKSYSDSVLKGWPPGNYGVAHADELQYMFLYNGYPEIDTSSKYYQISKYIVNQWAKFGADGKPGDEWLAFEPKKQEKWFNLDDISAMTDIPTERMQLWDSYSAHDLTYE